MHGASAQGVGDPWTNRTVLEVSAEGVRVYEVTSNSGLQGV